MCARADVVHIIAPGPVGGMNTVVRLLARGQLERGHRVSVIVIEDRSGLAHPFVDEARQVGVHAVAVNVGTRAYREERRRISEILENHTPSVVHTHGYRADVVDAPVARSLGIPVVTTVHGFTGGSWKNRCYQWVQRRAFRRFDAVAVVSQPLVAEIARSGVDPKCIHLIPNAFRAAGAHLGRADARRALGLDAEAFIVGWVGRLSREKGADVLLDALQRVAPSVDLRASILGDGPERGSLERQALAQGISSRVRFHGTIAHAERYFAAFDVFVLSSRTEGTPMVLFEAMAEGVPIIATRVGGVSAVLRGSDDRLISSEDPVALASALELRVRVAPNADCAERARLRLAGEHGIERWIDGYDAIYAGVGRFPAPLALSVGK